MKDTQNKQTLKNMLETNKPNKNKKWREGNANNNFKANTNSKHLIQFKKVSGNDDLQNIFWSSFANCGVFFHL